MITIGSSSAPRVDEEREVYRGVVSEHHCMLHWTAIESGGQQGTTTNEDGDRMGVTGHVHRGYIHYNPRNKEHNGGRDVYARLSSASTTPGGDAGRPPTRHARATRAATDAPSEARPHAARPIVARPRSPRPLPRRHATSRHVATPSRPSICHRPRLGASATCHLSRCPPRRALDEDEAAPSTRRAASADAPAAHVHAAAVYASSANAERRYQPSVSSR